MRLEGGEFVLLRNMPSLRLLLTPPADNKGFAAVLLLRCLLPNVLLVPVSMATT